MATTEVSDEQKLHACVRNKDIEGMEALLAAGTDVDCVYYGMTPLMVAIDVGFTHIATKLIEKGSNVQVRDSQTRISPFQLAVTKNQVEVVRLLVGAGADPNEPIPSGETPLTYAARKKFTDLTQMLIQCKSYVNQLNTAGLTPLYIAATDGFSVITEKLLAAGANRDDQCTSDGYTPLISAVLNERTPVIKILLKAGADVNAQDNLGWTALLHAVCDSNEALVKLLLGAGARKDKPNFDGKTPVDEAQEHEMDNIIELLTK